MRAILVVAGILLAIGPAAAQEDASLCSKLAPLVREQAVDGRSMLNKTRASLPIDVRTNVEEGSIDDSEIRSADLGLPPEVRSEAAEAIIAATHLIAPLQNFVERSEIAASALESCAKP